MLHEAKKGFGCEQIREFDPRLNQIRMIGAGARQDGTSSHTFLKDGTLRDEVTRVTGSGAMSDISDLRAMWTTASTKWSGAIRGLALTFPRRSAALIDELQLDIVESSRTL